MTTYCASGRSSLRAATGNSRTLREVTRELAEAAGYVLDWTRSGVGTDARNALYVARDVEVFERAYPGLTDERAMATEDRAEYEAWWHLEKLKAIRGENTLEQIIARSLSSASRYRNENQT